MIKKNPTFSIGDFVCIKNSKKNSSGEIVRIVYTFEGAGYPYYYVVKVNDDNLCYLEKELVKI